MFWLQKATYSSIAACPLEFTRHQRDLSVLGLEACGRMALAPVQNLAQALLKLGHCELALGYAHAATRMAPQCLSTACFLAATACHRLQRYRAARVYLSHVRCPDCVHGCNRVHLCQSLFMSSAAPCGITVPTCAATRRHPSHPERALLITCWYHTPALVQMSTQAGDVYTAEIRRLQAANNAALPLDDPALEVYNVSEDQVTFLLPCRTELAAALVANLQRFTHHAAAQWASSYKIDRDAEVLMVETRLQGEDAAAAAGMFNAEAYKTIMLDARNAYAAGDVQAAMKMWHHALRRALTDSGVSNRRCAAAVKGCYVCELLQAMVAQRTCTARVRTCRWSVRSARPAACLCSARSLSTSARIS